MGQRVIEFASGEYYHIYNRGTDKRIIFNEASDYKRFIELLFLCNSTTAINVRNIYREYVSIFDYDRGEPIVAIGAYCLMPNHFHILLTPLEEGGISVFMNKLGTSYSMYFNKKYQRSGALFEGKFKAQYANSDNYLKYLYAYIHLNPVKLIQQDWKEKGIINASVAYSYAASYQYSSLSDYVNANPTQKQEILFPDKFPQYFLNSEQQMSELIEWLTYSHI